MELDPPQLSIAVLAYDEEDNIGPVLHELRTWLEPWMRDAEILVVDDGSRDATSDAARRALEGVAHARVLRHEHNRGIGAALKTAVGAARGTWMTFLPADGQVPPEAIGTLWQSARNETDVVLSVYDHRDDGIHRTILSAGVRALIFAIHGVRMQSDGPYLFRRHLFDPRRLRSNTFFLNFEFPIRVLRAGLRVRVATIPCRPRRAGQSKSTGARRIAGVAGELIRLRIDQMREARASK